MMRPVSIHIDRSSSASDTLRVPAKVQLTRAIEAFRRGELDLALELAQEGMSVSSAPEWHHLAGLIHCRKRDPERGVEHLRLAAEAEPSNAGFKVMLARALIDSGNPAEVLRMEKPPATPSPAELALWHARAEAAGATGNGEAAAEAWGIIAASSKTDPEAWINLGRSLFALKRFPEAEEACLKALEAAPRNVNALLTLGLILERTNQLDELDRLLDHALSQGVSKAQLSYLWAVREHRAGNLGASRDLLLKSDPADDPVRWHRLRAKIADKEGDSATAFDAMVSMNHATVDFDEWRRRGAAFRQELRALASVLKPEWASRLPPLASISGRAPVFLLGLPRSGTTLLDTFLMGHPSVQVLEEKEILRRAGQILGPIVRLPDTSERMRARAQAAYLDELGTYIDPRFDGIVIDKNPFNMVLAPVIAALFRGSRVIFAKRHPCDVVLSGFMQSYVPNIGMASFLDLADAADLYDASMNVWMASAELFSLNVKTVAYEDLCENPAAQLRAVVDYLGLGWDQRVMDHRATAKARGALTNTSYDQITEELTSAAVGRWRAYVTQLEPVLPILLPWAKRLGYED